MGNIRAVQETATPTPTPTTAATAAAKKLSRWIRSRSVREKVAMAALTALAALIFLKLFVKNRNHFFVASQAAHSAGLLILLYKLTISKTCAGLSLRMQELTAIYLVVRLVSFMSFHGQVHLVLDLLSLAATLWVIYMMRFKLKSTYMDKLDNMPLYYVLVPCAIVALLGHPQVPFHFIFKFMWSFCATVEAVAVLPQLHLIQNAKMVEPFTAHYVFALGIARFFACANWIIQLIETKGAMLMLVGQGHIWLLVALLDEVVNTFILADFCYYYFKSVLEGRILMRLPSVV